MTLALPNIGPARGRELVAPVMPVGHLATTDGEADELS